MAKKKPAENALTGDEKILKIALDRYELGIEADDREEALEDLLFAKGEQWPADIKAVREKQKRPCVTVNRVQQMVKQVVNDMRQNRAGIKVRPAGDGASKEVAEIYSGLIRQIEASSNAPDHYISAGEGAVMIGRGHFRILPQYEEDSFDQCLIIERIRNHFSVVMDPNSKKPDGSDHKWAFITDEMPRDEFDAEFPDAIGEFDAASVGDSSNAWITKDYVRVAEYYALETEDDVLYALADGSTAKRSELPAAPPDELVLKSRKIKKTKCVWRKIISTKILETTSWDIKHIPVFCVNGEEYDIEGKLHRMGIVRHAKDPQRIYNYSRTAVVEQIALAPKAPYVIAAGQVEGFERYWETANTENHSYLPYKPTTVAGQAAPAPQRQAFAGVPAGSMADLSLASDEIKAVTGIYDAALGNKSNETSGKAIMARQREADNATYHYVDAFNRAIKLCGKVLAEFIPIIYDTQRIVRVLGEDGKEKVVKINEYDAAAGYKRNDLAMGKYEADISSGPSYETKRIEAVNSMTSFMQAVPNAAPLLADLIAKNMDWPGAEQIAKRLASMLPPEVAKAEADGDDFSPAIVAHIQEMQGVIKDLQDALKEQLSVNADLLDKKKIEDRKLDIDSYKAATDRLAALSDQISTEPDPKVIEQMVMSTLTSILQPLYTPTVETGGMPAPSMPDMPPQPLMGQPTAEMAGPLEGAIQ